MLVNNKDYKIIKELGKGKSGYSYLVSDCENNLYCLKKIHHEFCDYYNFGDKFQSEIDDYNRLVNLICVPKLIDVDYKNEIILKQYIPGKTIGELINSGENIEVYIELIKNIASICYKENINIDYYPTNFIYYNSRLFYLDYECNEYMEEWNLENWGIKYWQNIDISKK